MDCASLVEAVVAFLYQRKHDGGIAEWYRLALNNGYEPSDAAAEQMRPESTLHAWFRFVFVDVLDRGMVGVDALDGHEELKPLSGSPEEAIAAMKYNTALAPKAKGARVCLRRVYLPPDSEDTDPQDHVLDNEFEPSAVIGEVEWRDRILVRLRITDPGPAAVSYGGLDPASGAPLKVGDMITDYHFRWLDCAALETIPAVQKPTEPGWTGRIAPPDILDDDAALDRLFARIEQLTARHGVADGKGYPICENCFHHVETEQFSPVFGCAQHKIAVLASQTCDHFRTSPGGVPIGAHRVHFPDVAAMLDQIDGTRRSDLAMLGKRFKTSAGDSASEERYWDLAEKELELDELADAVLQRLAPGTVSSRLLDMQPEQVSHIYSRFFREGTALSSRIEHGDEGGVEPYDDEEMDILEQPWMLGFMTFSRCGRHAASAAFSALFHDKILADAPENSDKHLLGTAVALMTLEAFTDREIGRDEARTARDLGRHCLARAERNIAGGKVDAAHLAEQIAGVRSLVAEIERTFRF
ncbi:hypothetical protein TSH100_17065 [Azospirillum sp. TSH100]|nr:hypothetical protein [Azospirillum sp. TSH100]PWC84724.1 hypothetical protein TSH100_17065 [Azospirillum sp. TSH100]